MRREHRPKWHKTAWIVGIIVVLAAIFAGYYHATNPLRQARKEAVRIAENRVGVNQVSDFYWDTQRSPYLTVAGTTAKKQKVLVAIRQKTGKVQVLSQRSGISSQQAIAQVQKTDAPQKILKVGLSKRRNKFVWDVSFRTNSGKLSYVTYDFETGEQVAAIRNL